MCFSAVSGDFKTFFALFSCLIPLPILGNIRFLEPYKIYKTRQMVCLKFVIFIL